jgi:acyl-CoA dehydrogenase
MAARRLLKAAGLAEAAEGLTGIGVGDAGGMSLDGGRLTGTLRRVPFGRHLSQVVFAARDGNGAEHIVVAARPASVSADVNLAGEARDDLTFAGDAPVASAAVEGAADQVLAMGAAFRAVQIAGALSGALVQVLTYAGEREQFGRPIGKFQAVQHMLAVLAAETAAASAAAGIGFAEDGSSSALRAALAKSRTGQAATEGAALAHQIMGAMGFTREHPLHYQTRRLWSWRDEFGNEAMWQERLGREIAGRGGDALWPMLTSL